PSVGVAIVAGIDAEGALRREEAPLSILALDVAAAIVKHVDDGGGHHTLDHLALEAGNGLEHLAAGQRLFDCLEPGSGRRRHLPARLLAKAGELGDSAAVAAGDPLLETLDQRRRRAVAPLDVGGD